jgi:hypothetical protein
MEYTCPECSTVVDEFADGFYCRDCLFKKGKNVALKRKLSLYQEIISEATGLTEPKIIDEIEDMMRVEHPTLDHLTRAQLIDNARIAHEALIEMNRTIGLKEALLETPTDRGIVVDAVFDMPDGEVVSHQLDGKGYHRLVHALYPPPQIPGEWVSIKEIAHVGVYCGVAVSYPGNLPEVFMGGVCCERRKTSRPHLV